MTDAFKEEIAKPPGSHNCSRQTNQSVSGCIRCGSREGEKGLFIAMPSKKATDGEYRDIAHPINSSTRENLQRVILESYEKALEEPEEAI